MKRLENGTRTEGIKKRKEKKGATARPIMCINNQMLAITKLIEGIKGLRLRSHMAKKKKKHILAVSHGHILF